MSDRATVVVGEYQFEFEAQMARVALESSDIKAVVLADNAGGMFPALQLLFPVRVVVNAADAERAREVLDEMGPVNGETGAP